MIFLAFGGFWGNFAANEIFVNFPRTSEPPIVLVYQNYNWYFAVDASELWIQEGKFALLESRERNFERKCAYLHITEMCSSCIVVMHVCVAFVNVWANFFLDLKLHLEGLFLASNFSSWFPLSHWGIREMITNWRSWWLFHRFSLPAPYEMYRKQYGECICIVISRLIQPALSSSQLTM